MFGFEKWNNQLRLIKGCYSGRENVVSELLKVGAPAELSPLFTFKSVVVPHHSRVSFCSSARSTGGSCFRGGCGPEGRGFFEMSDIDQRVGT